MASRFATVSKDAILAVNEACFSLGVILSK